MIFFIEKWKGGRYATWKLQMFRILEQFFPSEEMLQHERESTHKEFGRGD